MRFLLARSDRADEVAQITRRHALQISLLSEFHWLPSSVGARVPLLGLEHLLAAQAEGRGVLLHLMHHGPRRIGNVLRARGIQTWSVASDSWLAEPPPGLRGHEAYAYARSLVCNSSMIPARGSFDGIRRLLGDGEIVLLASDLPGSLPARFLGRRILISSGTARLALSTGAPVVCATWHHRSRKILPLLRLHAGISSRGHDEPATLQAAILAVHEPAVLAWPEALEKPSERWRLAPQFDQVETRPRVPPARGRRARPA